MTQHRFVQGHSYENRKGTFKVLAIDGHRMKIQFDTGEQAETTTEDQERILRNMEREHLHALDPVTKSVKTTIPKWLGSQFIGLSVSDFNEDVTGTHWRCREQLGGAVTARIKSEEKFNSWAVYGRPEVQWSDIHRRNNHAPWLHSKFLVRLDSEHLYFGYLNERPPKSDPPRAAWDDFMKWLSVPSHVLFLFACMKKNRLNITDPYGESLLGVISPDGDNFVHRDRNNEVSVIELEELHVYLDALSPDLFVNVLLGSSLDKETVIAKGQGIARQIADQFNLLLPVYEEQVFEG
jgi:hypothetical protein